ncbi:PrgI family protein [Candidatus Pacebacteria bacterium]|nr:PrgI family protein [Candidatus Paceibacterota bacterium]
MARYQVPQFLEIEDKIFGPLTLKQFLYTMAGAAIGYMAWANLPLFVAVLVGGPLLALFLGLAFYKVNNRPLSAALENGFRYLTAPKLYLWKKRQKSPEKKAIETIRHAANMDMPALSGSKLKDLSWGLDIHETLETLADVEK